MRSARIFQTNAALQDKTLLDRPDGKGRSQ